MKNLRQKLFLTIDEINERIIAIRQDLHAHPELSGHEEHTKYLVKGILEASGYKIKERQTFWLDR